MPAGHRRPDETFGEDEGIGGPVDGGAGLLDGWLVGHRAESAIRQGITTQLVGNCGFSAAPISVEHRASYRRDGLMFSHDGYDWDWSTMREYRQRLKHAAVAINVLTLVGHTTLRAAVLGQVARPATDAELALMRHLLEQALDDGAVGLSSGLTYTPGCYAPTSELATLVDVLGGSGLGYHTHMRNYGPGCPRRWARHSRSRTTRRSRCSCRICIRTRAVGDGAAHPDAA